MDRPALPPLAASLRAFRHANGLTLEQAAKALSVAPRTLGYWEAGRHAPRGDHLLRLAELYRVSSLSQLTGAA